MNHCLVPCCVQNQIKQYLQSECQLVFADRVKNPDLGQRYHTQLLNPQQLPKERNGGVLTEQLLPFEAAAANPDKNLLLERSYK